MEYEAMKYERSDCHLGGNYVVERGIPLPKPNRWMYLADAMSAGKKAK